MNISVFGESHGPAVGVLIEGLPPGLRLDFGRIEKEMRRRAPGRDDLSTPRAESDAVEIISGVMDGVTTGMKLCAVIKNENTRPGDYELLKRCPRPSHADFAAHVRYGGFQDYRGGGHFSGRLTAPYVFAGAVAKQLLEEKNIAVGAHIAAIAGISDTPFDLAEISARQLAGLSDKPFPVLSDAAGEKMREAVLKAKGDGDSVGGVIECAVTGMPAGFGEPGFSCAEGIFSRYLFAVPAVKGVEFGAGFSLARMTGSEANDAFYMEKDRVRTLTNHNGGINGGITNGMPVVFRAAVKPTPSIAKEQRTVDLSAMTDCKIRVAGRHDPCVVPRAVPAVEAAAALAALEILEGRGGTK